MIVTLFIATDSPFMSGASRDQDRMCLAVRRLPWIDAKTGLRGLSIACPQPTLEAKDFTHRVIHLGDAERVEYAKRLIVSQAFADLGPKAAKRIRKALSQASEKAYLLIDDKDERIETYHFGVSIPDIFDVARMPASYGTLDVMMRENIDAQEKRRKIEERAIRKQVLAPIIVQVRQFQALLKKAEETKEDEGYMTINGDLDHDDIPIAKSILAHFEKQEAIRRGKIKDIPYASSASASGAKAMPYEPRVVERATA